MKQKVILNILIGIQILENTLYINDCIYSILYQHYEYVAMCILCVFVIILLLFLLENTKVTIFNNKKLRFQQACLNCGRMSKDYKCKECKICLNCNSKFHSNYLNKLLNSQQQTRYILKNIWLLILKCFICTSVRIYAVISYLEDDTNLFLVFYISLSGGVILDLTISLFLLLIYKSLSKEQSNIETIVKKKSEMKINSIEQSGSKNSSSSSTQLNKQMKILEFLEKKLSHRNNFVNSQKMNETEPIPIMFDENEENVVQFQMQQVNGFIPLTLKISVNDTSNNVPVQQQIISLNSQPIMQVRRPSDLNSSFTPIDSQHSTHNMQKSPLCTSGAIEGRATPLNLINEESSVNEQSDNKVFENLINKKLSPQIHDLIIREPVHWSQIFTHQGTHKEDDQFNKYGSYLGDNIYVKEQINQDLQTNIKPIVIIVQVILYMYYMYQFPLLLYGVAYSDYDLTYQLQTQLPLLFLNFLLFSLNIQKTAKFIDYLPLASFIPFICTLIDFKQQVIFMQIIHIVTFTRFYHIFKQLLQISICFRQYSIYFFALRISQIHIFQSICGFLIVITQMNRNHESLNEFYQNQCSLVNILVLTNNQSILIYPIKIIVLIFVVYQFTIISDQINYLYRNQSTLISGLQEFSKIIQQLPFDLKYESLQISNKQMQQRLKTRNLIDYDKLPKTLSSKLLNAQYQNTLRKLPLIDKCLSKRSIANILMNASKERILEPNEILIEAQQENKFLYFILSGKVKCYQQRQNKQFPICINENGIYNQTGFFLEQYTDFYVQCETCCKILEINSEQFWKELKQNITELEKIKMCLDRVQFNQEYKLIGISCQICKGNHKIDNCKKIHYVPPKQMLMDYIYFDEINRRQKYQRRNHIRKFRCMKNTSMIEQVVCNVRHLLLLSSETFRRPKTITSIGMQFEQQHTEHSEEEEHHKMSQYVQNLSPVQYVPQVGSSASSYVLKELKQAQQLKSPKDSFMVHQKRYQEKRQSHVTKIERDLSPSIIKYATIQDKRSQKSKSIISEDHNNGILQSSDHKQFSKYGIQSSKFTNETAKQFLNNPFDMPLYDLNQSIDNNHSYSDYFPRNNIDQALFSYKQYQDSIISNKSKQNS